MYQNDGKKDTAIIVAGGKGNRMGTELPKQYLELNGKPVVAYSLDAFEKSFIDEVILVTAEEFLDYCKEEIVNRYGYRKVKHIVAGGRERYDSVENGLAAAEGSDYVYIHDAARPYLPQNMLVRLAEGVRKYGAVTAAMPSKDTIKEADENGISLRALDRSRLWNVQTPQVFSYELIAEAFRKMKADSTEGVTDDTVVVEKYMQHPVKMIEGSYSNYKITTPDDMIIMQALLGEKFPNA
jgi:2-C-methyl-D-erythritol 4-phosphate cytidylyltransferase